MIITSQIVESIASLYTLSELREELKNAVTNLLQNPDRIISASTGAGASYTKALNISPQEYVELLSCALQFKETGIISTGGSNQWNVVTFYPYNL